MGSYLIVVKQMLASIFFLLVNFFRSPLVLLFILVILYAADRKAGRGYFRVFLWSACLIVSVLLLAFCLYLCAFAWIDRNVEFVALLFGPAITGVIVFGISTFALWRGRPSEVGAAKELKKRPRPRVVAAFFATLLLLVASAYGTVEILRRIWDRTVILRVVGCDGNPVAGAVVVAKYESTHLSWWAPEKTAKGVTDKDGLVHLHVVEPVMMKIEAASPQGKAQLVVSRPAQGGQFVLSHEWLYPVWNGTSNVVNEVAATVPAEYPLKVVLPVMGDNLFCSNDLLENYDRVLTKDPRQLFDSHTERLPFNAMVFRHDSDLGKITLDAATYKTPFDVTIDQYFASQAYRQLADLRQELEYCQKISNQDAQRAEGLVTSVENMLGVPAKGSFQERLAVLLESVKSKENYFKSVSKEYNKLLENQR